MNIPHVLTDWAGLIANTVSIGTPVILLIWFLVTSKRQLSDQYFNELPGYYGGFTKPLDPEFKVNEGGVLLRILNIDANGYFQREFDFGEHRATVTPDNRLFFEQLRDGIYTCMGKMDHHIYRSKVRNPMDAAQNRTYTGKFFVVDRLDIDFRSYNIQQYIQMEYDITHFREMKTLELKLVKVHREISQLPADITLYKQIGLHFDVYNSVKDTSFRGDS